MTPITSDTLPGGKRGLLVMWRNSRLKLTDMEGGANVGMLFYNPTNLLERYNAPDTLKCQHTFKLTRGNCLYSDMGRVFCSIVEDTAGWHDTVCGNTTKKIVAQKWGERRYQQYRNDWQLNGYDSFLVEVAKYGLGKRIWRPTSTCSARCPSTNRARCSSIPQPPGRGALSTCVLKWIRWWYSTPVPTR